MAKTRALKSWMNFETRFAAGEAVPESDDLCEKAMVERMTSGNYRLSEALLLSNASPADLLQEVRTRIARGDIRDAEALLSESLADSTKVDPVLVGDLYLELARVYFQKGNCLGSIEMTNRALGLPEVHALNRLTLLQIRSGCWFEIGDWQRCLADIDVIRSLSLLYPKAQSAFYSEVLRVKAVARVQGPLIAEKNFRALLEETGRANLDANAILTFLRLRIDLNRLQEKPVAPFALAAFHLSNAMGDALYAALALVDLAYCEVPTLRDESTPRLVEIRRQFERVDLLLSEREKTAPATESAKVLNLSRTDVPSSTSIEDSVKTLVFLSSEVHLDLRTLKTTNLSLQERTVKVLETLARGPVEKDVLFHSVWKIRFVSDRHDVILRNALLRARKQAKIAISSRDRSISLEETQVLELLVSL